MNTVLSNIKFSVRSTSAKDIVEFGVSVVTNPLVLLLLGVSSIVIPMLVHK
ncbi:MAG: hypothetical protein NTX72_06105 [Candidatus Uhrbacteria bacterium]|nr:hypothetical protein [Candidatus Uhrbacteria bacterium]